MKNIPPHIFKLVSSYILKDITEEEFVELQNWVNEDPENKQLFRDYLSIYKKSRRLRFVEKIDSDLAWSKVVGKLNKSLISNNRIEDENTSVKRLKNNFNFFKYAAIALLFLGIGYLYQNGNFQNKIEALEESNSITLQLNDGKIKIIDDNGKSKVLDAKGNVIGEQSGVELVYANKGKAETLVYNTLAVPYGKRFKIKLSDGTNVHLNAGSSLKYPINFIKDENRQVFLKGEAYFDVAKDAKHPFVVNADNMNVRVLGTQFNISSYPEDRNINTVLVEGSVSVYNNKESYNLEKAIHLKPGFKASFEKDIERVTIKKADIEMATAWRDGKVIFRYTPFEDIVKKLERHYNVTIINNNKNLGKQRFGASFDIESIEQVFESFNANFEIEYTIKDNQIIINESK